jgi:hypothetical protein
MVGIFVRVKGAVETEIALRKITKRLGNPADPFRVIAEDFADMEGAAFAAGGKIAGLAGWAKLRPYTIADKQRNNYPSAILVRTGRLKASLTNVSNPDFSFRLLSNKSLEIGTRVHYAKYLKKGRKNMKKRNAARVPRSKAKVYGAIFRRYAVTGKLGKNARTIDFSVR